MHNPAILTIVCSPVFFSPPFFFSPGFRSHCQSTAAVITHHPRAVPLSPRVEKSKPILVIDAPPTWIMSGYLELRMKLPNNRYAWTRIVRNKDCASSWLFDKYSLSCSLLSVHSLTPFSLPSLFLSVTHACTLFLPPLCDCLVLCH